MGSQHEAGGLAGFLPGMGRNHQVVDCTDASFASFVALRCIALHWLRGPLSWFGGHRTGVTEPPRLTSDSIVYGGPQGWNPHFLTDLNVVEETS